MIGKLLGIAAVGLAGWVALTVYEGNTPPPPTRRSTRSRQAPASAEKVLNRIAELSYEQGILMADERRLEAAGKRTTDHERLSHELEEELHALMQRAKKLGVTAQAQDVNDSEYKRGKREG